MKKKREATFETDHEEVHVIQMLVCMFLEFVVEEVVWQYDEGEKIVTHAKKRFTKEGFFRGMRTAVQMFWGTKNTLEATIMHAHTESVNKNCYTDNR